MIDPNTTKLSDLPIMLADAKKKHQEAKKQLEAAKEATEIAQKEVHMLSGMIDSFNEIQSVYMKDQIIKEKTNAMWEGFQAFSEAWHNSATATKEDLAEKDVAHKLD